MSKTSLQQQITVHALPSKVWRVLTSSEYTNQHLHDGVIICDWMEGSAIQLIPNKEEAIQPLQVGEVLETLPGLLLKFSFREGNTSTYIVTTFELIVTSDGVDLKIKCEGFTATQQEYLIRVQQTNLLLQKIKWLAEYS